MKTLVMTVIIVVSAIADVFGSNNQKEFTCNEVKNGNLVKSDSQTNAYSNLKEMNL